MRSENQFSLLKSTRFASYFWTQCLGALNDNVLRNGLVMLVTYGIVDYTSGSPEILANIVGAVFILPFLLFSAPAGQIADRTDKASLIRRIKLAEILLAILALALLAFQTVNGLVLLVFAMGVQSTFFGPIKYAILPDLVPRESLVGANGLVEGGTYLAIIVGLFIGGTVATVEHSGPYLLGGSLLFLALVGYWTSRSIPSIQAADPTASVSWNLWRDSLQVIRQARQERSVFLSIIGLSWFWTFGFVALMQLPALARDTVNASPTLANILLCGFAIGTGAGAMLCERLSRRHIELGLVPIGAIGLTVFAFDIWLAWGGRSTSEMVNTASFFSSFQGWRLIVDLAMLGLSGGLFSVPLYAMMQDRSDPAVRARVVAANNVLNSVMMIAGALFAIVLLMTGVEIPGIFLTLALMNIAVTAFLFTLLPEFIMRFVTWCLVRVLYRLRVQGHSNLPSDGAALVVANHVSFVDALLLGAAIPRPARFVMYYKIFNIPLLRQIFRTAKAIPIAGFKEDPDTLDAAFEKIDQELQDGNIVCIFPEGAITRDGAIQAFRPGVERILKRRPVPVIPVGLQGLWGSWFSRSDGGAIRKWPRRFRAPIDVVIGSKIAPDDASAASLEQAVRELVDD
ncbi:MAG: MFS transporter [Pseudomonadota bacterium]